MARHTLSRQRRTEAPILEGHGAWKRIAIEYRHETNRRARAGAARTLKARPDHLQQRLLGLRLHGPRYLADGGAMLEFRRASRGPIHFELVMEPVTSRGERARCAGASEHAIGVSFDDASQ